jgi:hypothetical protein
VGSKVQKLRQGIQSEGENVEECRPIGSLRQVTGREEIRLFQGSPKGVVFLFGAVLCSLRL